MNEVARNEMMYAEYDSPYGKVKLDANIVKSYLTKGNVAITDSEVVMFLEICKRQKLDPFVTGEVFLIKYKESSPAQVVVGYNTYKRRAEENPNYLGKEEGIIVLRGTEIVKKEGACVYPNEKILGGWCKVSYLKSGFQVASYKEVEFNEYKQDNAMWRGKPGMMICKVAVSQALRDAFPTEMNGLYTAEELAPAEAKEEDFKPIKVAIEKEVTKTATEETKTTNETVVADVIILISEKQRKELFDKAQEVHGKYGGITWLKEELLKLKLTKTSELNIAQLETLLKKLDPAEEPEEVGIEQTELPFDVEE